METPPEQQLHGDIPLYLVAASKATEMSPDGIAIGYIRLHGWQIQQIDPIPSDLDGRSAYLVRLTYDFDIDPEVPPPSWAEVEFEFHLKGAVVRDALPRAVVAPAGHESYQLSEHLYFVPRSNGDTTHWPAGSAAAHIPLSPLTSQLTCSGINGTYVRWRHTGGVPVGSHTAYLVLELPEQFDRLPVIASGRYELPAAAVPRLRPISLLEAFEVRLTATPNGSRRAGDEPAARVFVSYAPESAEHVAAVRELSGLLEKAGFTVHFDRRRLESSPDWDRWITTHLVRADVVLVVVSPKYLAAAGGALPEGDQFGVAIDHGRLTYFLEQSPDTWPRRIVPIQLPGGSPAALPTDFLPGVREQQIIESLTWEGLADLFDRLRNR